MSPDPRKPDSPNDDRADRVQAIIDEMIRGRANGREVNDAEVLAAHPDIADLLVGRLQQLRLIQAAGDQAQHDPYVVTVAATVSAIASATTDAAARPGPHDVRMGHAADDIELNSSAFGFETDQAAAADQRTQDDMNPDSVKSIGRYEVQKKLGSGGFGKVYLALDGQLNRLVAIKTPHARLVSRAEDADLYLNEARTVAILDHPNIVPVFDVGSAPECPFYVVSKYIEGVDLACLLRKSRLAAGNSAKLVASVADALHYAHKQGIVHRDVKPGNILIDGDGQPYVVDFGLALREEHLGKGLKYAGTPAYMSPEQARGEGHRVDGRSDMFSLGIVLYELLTGRRPFVAHTQVELLEQITAQEPKPPRQIDDSVPKELERICLKALSKRAMDRYTTARDMADDLRHFLAVTPQSIATPQGTAPTAAKQTALETAKSAVTPTELPTSDGQPIKIVPKGLRSFDARDADFFLELLPGPRDRDGLPDSLRFWRSRIEETDGDSTFAVGLIYGPSGCGKSSLVKAGLLPRLSDHVIAVYVEATADETETRLLKDVRKRCPALPENLGIRETLAAMRRGQGIPPGKKVLIVLDQFEQWLHAKKEDENTDLIQALRQCDGSRVQCVVMVRDDFWMAATRFMRELEVRLVEGQNSAAVDLFPIRHAEKVLAAFGRAFGILPDNSSEVNQEQKSFLTQAVADLAQEGKVVCVRLALFAEMMKGKPWMPATLKEVGGTLGVGATFLEETFSASTAPPEHRYHQKSARAVLKSLLPEAGTDIKGEMKSYEVLLEASGYASRPREFAELLRILDSEIRLITPTDPEGQEDSSAFTKPANAKYYQLTHDYLVPSLRDWLTRKQKETRRGRAELRLAERAATWNAKPESRQLPSLWEYLNIRLLTGKPKWNTPERKMMRTAGRTLGLRWGSALLLLMIVGIAVQKIAAETRDRSLREQVAIVVASIRNLRGPAVSNGIRELAAFPPELASAELKARLADSEPSQVLALKYAMAQYGSVDVEFFVSQMSAASPDEVDNLVAALGNTKQEALDAIQAAATTSTAEQNWRHKSRLAIVALHLGDPNLATDMCLIENRPDPVQRTMFINECASWHGDPSLLAQLADTINDPPLRSSLALGVGSIAADRLTPEAKQVWTRLLLDWYQHQPDAVTHSAAGWVLRTWKVDPQDEPTTIPSAELPEEWRQRLSTLASNVKRIEQQLVETEKELPARQQAWETELIKKSLAAILSDGLVAHFPLDEPSGSKVANTVAGREGGMFAGTEVAAWTDGLLNRALSLDGTGGHVDCGQEFQPDKDDAFSYGCWFRTANSRAQALIAKVDTALRNRGFDVVLKSDRVEANFRHESDVDNRKYEELKVASPMKLTDDTWHHVFVTYDGTAKAGGVKIYVDGRPATVSIETDSLRNTFRNTTPLSIGKRSREYYFRGTIDEVRLYARELSAEEVQQICASDVASLVRIPRSQRTVAQATFLTKHYLSGDAVRNSIQVQLETSQKALARARLEAWQANWKTRSQQWHVNSIGMTLLAVRTLGRHDDERQEGSDEKPDMMAPFLIGDREVSASQFQLFIDDPNNETSERPIDWPGRHVAISPTGKHPIQQVSWHDAVMFCNWLSRRESLTPCYEPSPDKRDGPNAWRLIPQATGYRLPTESEWEQSCRADTITAFSFGDNESLLDLFAVYRQGHAEVCGSKLPNGWGLFDIHGSVWEWCDDDCALRGGAFIHSPAHSLQSTSKLTVGKHSRNYNYGFRVVRSWSFD